MKKQIVAAVVPAAGSGKRLGARVPKAFVPVFGIPLFVHTLRALFKAYPFVQTVLVVGNSRVKTAESAVRRLGLGRVQVVRGGATRAESVRRGLLALDRKVSLVAVHDAARPLVSAGVVRRTLAAAARSGAAICALPVSSTVKRVNTDSMTVLGTEDRGRLYLAQTPQVFDKALLLSRYRHLGKKARHATDEAALFDGSSVRVRVVDGDEMNLKVTTPNDLQRFKSLVRAKA